MLAVHLRHRCPRRLEAPSSAATSRVTPRSCISRHFTLMQVLKESMALSSRPAALPRRGTDATGDADSYLPWDAAVPSEMAELRPRVSARCDGVVVVSHT